MYWWADGIYSNVRLSDRLCLLVIIGMTEQGHKKVDSGRRRLSRIRNQLTRGADWLAHKGLESQSQIGGR